MKVFCKNCKYYPVKWWQFWKDKEKVGYVECSPFIYYAISVKKWLGKVRVVKTTTDCSCMTENQNNDCEYYKQKLIKW